MLPYLEYGLISGSVTYDPGLEPAATGNLLICSSSPQEDLVIDISFISRQVLRSHFVEVKTD